MRCSRLPGRSTLVSGITADNHLGASVQEFLGSLLGSQARTGLQSHYQPFRSDGYASLEIGERLMRPEAYADLGLTREQAGKLAAQYVDLLNKEYGRIPSAPIVRRVGQAFPGSIGGTEQAPEGGGSEGARHARSVRRSGNGEENGPSAGDVDIETSQERSERDSRGVTLGSGLGALQPYLEEFGKEDPAGAQRGRSKRALKVDGGNS